MLRHSAAAAPSMIPMYLRASAARHQSKPSTTNNAKSGASGRGIRNSPAPEQATRYSLDPLLGVISSLYEQWPRSNLFLIYFLKRADSHTELQAVPAWQLRQILKDFYGGSPRLARPPSTGVGFWLVSPAYILW